MVTKISGIVYPRSAGGIIDGIAIRRGENLSIG